MLELGGELVPFGGLRAHERERRAGRDSLDAANSRTHGAFGKDDERADLRGRAHMSAAAELP